MPEQKKQTTLSFREHLRELRKRLFWCVATVACGVMVGWIFHNQVIEVLRQPLKEELYFTTPTGGLEFIISISIFVGIVLATPVLVYQLMQFVRPISKKISFGRIVYFMLASVVLALAGISFGYFVSLPAALHFLLEFNNGQVSALINANDYVSFVMVYLAGFALIFQLPLVLLFINRITPLPPKKLMAYQKPVIILSFVGAAILTPTPDPVNQLIMALPMIILYQVALVCVLLSNKLRGVEFTWSVPATKNAASNSPKAPIGEMQTPAAVSQIKPITARTRAEMVSPRQLAVPKIKSFNLTARVINLNEIDKRLGRKQPSSRLFHNANLPPRKFDIGLSS